MDKRKIVVGLQMSSNTFRLAGKTNNGTVNEAVGPGEGNQRNDEGRLKYFEVKPSISKVYLYLTMYLGSNYTILTKRKKAEVPSLK